jgi:hypothetical protein
MQRTGELLTDSAMPKRPIPGLVRKPDEIDEKRILEIGTSRVAVLNRWAINEIQ